MRVHFQSAISAAAVTLVLGVGTAYATAAGAVAAPPTAAGQPSVWQHRQARFTYSAFTTAYSCDGIEDKVARILKFFGARAAKVQAIGCVPGPNTPTHMILIDVQFDTLAAAGGDQPEAQIVQAQWTSVQLDARRPFFMDEGDCELIDSLKPVLTANFSFQDLSYATACTPHQLSLEDFRVNGKVLKPLQGHAG